MVTILASSGFPARADLPTPSIDVRLVGSDGAPASDALVYVGVPGPGRGLVRVEPSATGLVSLMVPDLTKIALPEDLAQRHVNYLIHVYSFEQTPTQAGTYAADVSVIGFVLDTLTGTPTTSPSPDGATYTLRPTAIELTATDADCQAAAPDVGVVCDYEQHFDADLQGVALPFMTNYGGGIDWASTYVVETSKTIKTEWVVKVGGDPWAKGEGKLTTSQTDQSSLSTPESARLGNSNLGISQDKFIEWQYVREVAKLCALFGAFCTSEQYVRPWEWTGAIIPGPTQAPSYPYDQAGEPSIDNQNCTRRYEDGLRTGIGNDESLMTTFEFGASGGYRDEFAVQATWNASTDATFDLSHNYYVVDDNYKMHFLFVPWGLAAQLEGATCPEDDITQTYTDAANHDLTNVGVGEMPQTPFTVVCPDEVPSQLRRIACD